MMTVKEAAKGAMPGGANERQTTAINPTREKRQNRMPIAYLLIGLTGSFSEEVAQCENF
ncbi:MAG: hypothetical protein NT123_23785 [Proteobacteria bacterium]|nr:hypothetical protein [Pseudomonadota bacterium]